MNIVIPKPVNEVLNIINEKGYEAYLVGGAVRNWVMDLKPSNYNISTNASLEEIKKALKGYQTFYCGENDSHLGIVNTKFPMEVAKYRSADNTLESDLAMRDFTMNALAYSDEDGLIDYNTGVMDIKNKIIKVNGEDDEIFVNDPLRIIRAIRLSAEYAMRIDPDTQEYMNDDRDLLQDVATERVRDELCKLLVIPRADFYIKKYFDIFVEVLPELALLERFNQNDPKHIYDALEHTLVALKVVEPKLELRLATLFHDIGKLTIPDHIIKKPGKLTDEEYAIIKTHSKKGYELLKKQKADIHVQYSALMHHEKCDGTGYPLKLIDNQIDWCAQIVTIADIYEAMTAKRVYRKALSPFTVISNFEEDGLRKYNPKFLLTFLERVVNSYMNCKVKLSNGEEGDIVYINKVSLSKPMVKTRNNFIDLSKNSELSIESLL